MKKVVRTVWISVLSGLAFLVACTCQNRLTRAEKKQLKEERAILMEQIEKKQQEAAIYESPGAIMNLKMNERELRARVDEINLKLGDEQARLANIDQLNKIENQIDSLKTVIEESMIIPCVYGPPVNDPGYKEWKREQTRNELMQQLDSINNILKRREGACVYGSPEVIQKYGEETRRLRNEAANLEKRLQELDNE